MLLNRLVVGNTTLLTKGARLSTTPALMATRFKAVIFDLGGVVYGNPTGAARAYAASLGASPEAVKQIYTDGATKDLVVKLETGRVKLDDKFCDLFTDSAKTVIGAFHARDFFMAVQSGLQPIHNNVIDTIKLLREAGIKTAALSNTWEGSELHPLPLDEHTVLFDAIVQSAKVGLRKPNPEIYKLVTEKLGVDARECVFIDDMGRNCVAASDLGMTAIHVTNNDTASAMAQVRSLLIPAQPTPSHSAAVDSVLPASHRFDESALLRYLIAHKYAPQNSSLTVQKFSHGQSNPTYLLTLKTDQSAPIEYVLRKQPSGALLKGAHNVTREHTIYTHLRTHSSVPVPHSFCVETDRSVIGTDFCLMSYVNGTLFKDPAMPSEAPQTRKAVYASLVRTLVALHSAPLPQTATATQTQQTDKLEKKKTKKKSYYEHQIALWSKQYSASVAAEGVPVDPRMSQLSASLPTALLAQQHQQLCDTSGASGETTTLVHGDYRLDNLLFDPHSLAVNAVLDWELSSTGCPLSDLAYLCVPYHIPRSSQSLPGLHDPHSPLPEGIPTESQLVDLYFSLSPASLVRPSPLHWNLYVSFAFFRVAAILAGVRARSKGGQASSRQAVIVGNDTDKMITIAHNLFLSAQPKTNTTQSNTKPSTRSRSYHTHAHSHHPNSLLFSRPSYSLSHSSRRRFSSSSHSSPLFPVSERAQRITDQVDEFIRSEIIPIESVFMEHQFSDSRWTIVPQMEQLKAKAKSAGLWNLFLPLESDNGKYGAGLTNAEYARIAELTGRSMFAPEVFNCSAPDTGNMETLVRYGTDAQKTQWLVPLLAGEIRSCFAMTEPAVASCDATNIESSIRVDPDDSAMLILNGHKHWISGAMDPRCNVAIFMGKSRHDGPTHTQQSMVLVPMDAPGVTVVRPLRVFGFDDAPHGHAEMRFENVRVPVESLLVGHGHGFAIAQGRLGPGRIHHCMRLIGHAERALELMCERVTTRVAFGKTLSEMGMIRNDIARSRAEINQARLLTLEAASLMDRVGNKAARKEIALIKVVAPEMAQRVIDRAMQAFGANGLSSDTPLSQLFAWARVLRLADGPSEVHLESVAKMELKKYAQK